MIPKNTPLGISQVHLPDEDMTVLTWSYLESSDIEYFEIEYYDEEKRKWVPFDGRSGIVKRK